MRCGRTGLTVCGDLSGRDSSKRARNDIEFNAGSICYGLSASSHESGGGRGNGAHGEKLWCEFGQETIFAEVLDLLDMLSRSFVVFRIGKVVGEGLWEEQEHCRAVFHGAESVVVSGRGVAQESSERWRLRKRAGLDEDSC